MIRKFWLVWNENGQFPRYKHDSEQSARTEAERLTRNVGGKFHVLELIGTCERMDIQWHRAEHAPRPKPVAPEPTYPDDDDDSDPFAEDYL